MSETIIYNRDTSTSGGDYKARVVANGIGHYGHNAQTCLDAKAGMKDGTATSYYYSDVNHNLGMRVYDHYNFHMAFQTLLPPNSPHCTQSTNSQWMDEAIVSAGSNHAGGVQVALLDASCRFVSETINVKNLNRISTTKVRPTDATGVFSYGVWAEIGSINGDESTAVP